MLLVVDAGKLTVVDHQETNLVAGEGAMRPAGTVLGLRNPGDGKTIFLVLTAASG
jgi:hypothetical protein